jgi:hypothetical protein
MSGSDAPLMIHALMKALHGGRAMATSDNCMLIIDLGAMALDEDLHQTQRVPPGIMLINDQAEAVDGRV